MISHELGLDNADSSVACAKRHCRFLVGMAETPGEQQGNRRQRAERCL
nr:MAG TPA: hypothetical protein [Caudoviricetes sp.]